GKNSLNRLIRLFAGKKSAQIREILISESAWEEMTCLFAPSPALARCGDLVCRKIKLKNFYDPETAGGCGVAPFSSRKDLFCQAHTLPAPCCAHDLFCMLRWIV
ncbi:hypothetical protein, partial [Klebsiella quasipneumoniae]|uniref:hypothetical protein n=1 Tax=Klebsiella quasipneumoniae TaxID=1463165 RepID=UPI003B42D99F